VLIIDLLKSKEYYNVAAILMAINGNRKPLVECCGEKEAFKLIRQTLDYKQFANRIGSLEHYPIALTPCGKIYRDHFQIASAILAGFDSVGMIQKKIPCEFQRFNEEWARKVFSNFEEVDNYYDSIIEVGAADSRNSE
jgi:hypothetical protein